MHHGLNGIQARSLSVRDMMDLGQRPETLAALLNEAGAAVQTEQIC